MLCRLDRNPARTYCFASYIITTQTFGVPYNTRSINRCYCEIDQQMTMPASFDSVPVELQEQILDHLYQPWHLVTKEVPAFNRTTIFTFSATSSLTAAPLRTCKAMRKTALSLMERKFSGLLNASNTRHDEHHSIMPKPKYKIFLPRITKLVLGSFGSLATMGGIYQQRLPGLQIIEVAPAEKLLMLHAQAEAFAINLQKQHDNLFIHLVNTYWHYCKCLLFREHKNAITQQLDSRASLLFVLMS